MVQPDVGVLRPQGRPAGARHRAGWCATSTCPCGSSCARRSASPTAWRSPAATPVSSGDERERALALSRALREVSAAIADGTLADGDAVRDAGLAAAASPRGRAGVLRDRRPRDARPGRPPGPRPAARHRSARRPRPPDRQPSRRTHVPDPRCRCRGGDSPGLGGASTAEDRSNRHVHHAHQRPGPGRRLAPADDASAPVREEAPRRADRDGHRLRPPERACGRGGRRRPRPDGRLGRDDRARLPVDRRRRARRAARARQGRAARAAQPVPDRRPAVRLVRGQRRAGRHHRAALRQGGRLRRRQARGRRRDVGAPRACDRRRRHPRHGPRRPDAADLDRAGRLQGPGPHGRRGGADRRRGARAAGGRLLRDRVRGDPARASRRR